MFSFTLMMLCFEYQIHQIYISQETRKIKYILFKNSPVTRDCQIEQKKQANIHLKEFDLRCHFG